MTVEFSISWGSLSEGRGTTESMKTRRLIVSNYPMAKLPLDLPNEPCVPIRFLKRIHDPFIPKGHNENILAWPVNEIH
jgi:hypothetical protein